MIVSRCRSVSCCAAAGLYAPLTVDTASEWRSRSNNQSERPSEMVNLDYNTNVLLLYIILTYSILTVTMVTIEGSRPCWFLPLWLMKARHVNFNRYDRNVYRFVSDSLVCVNYQIGYDHMDENHTVTYMGPFTCPLPFEQADFTKCCGEKGAEFCCFSFDQMWVPHSQVIR